ncbi:hypothetical protein [Candidatus Palauibacter sp.]|uniref:hypothetical protein n=1 Tax=Candidatus Palauibacter sp. TaxID=3101350 RepID=UPI003B01C63A
MPHSFVRLSAPALVLVVANSAAAQSYADFCPGGNPETEAAVVGYVTDPEAATIVPGATVAASWVQFDARQRVEAEVGMEGLYAICGLPRDMEVSLRAIFGDRRGEAVPYTTTVTLAQQDLSLSLTAVPRREEVGSLAGGGSRSRILGSEVIRAEDLVDLPEMSVYELLRQHSLLKFDRMSTLGEVILLTSVTLSSWGSFREQAMEVRINERREGDGVNAIRELSIDEVSRIEILTRTEASARYGGDGYIGALVITTRDR